jgi:hypothetical protein
MHQVGASTQTTTKGQVLSFIPFQLRLAPMRFFTIGIEHPHHVAVQRSHDADLSHHGIAAAAELARQVAVWQSDMAMRLTRCKR